MDIKAKLRPFYVAKMLNERTDEEHYLTIAQIMDILEKEYGISTSRGTVGDDIKALQEFGMEIEVEPSTQNRYYLIGRKFDLPELKLLIDATESARFITKEKSDMLVKKLASLSSSNNASALTRNIDVENRIKAENEKIYYIIDALNEAINRKKKVSFQYFTYNVKKQKKLKSHLKAVNEVRPIETVKRIGYESIPYLAAHSEDWLARTASGLKPARLFSRVEDDEFQIYENRVTKTLIDLILSFLRKKENIDEIYTSTFEILWYNKNNHSKRPWPFFWQSFRLVRGNMEILRLLSDKSRL